MDSLIIYPVEKEEKSSTGYELNETKYYFNITKEDLYPEVDVTEKTAALEDGINDAWTQDNKADGDTVTVENGWLHIKSAAGNHLVKK